MALARIFSYSPEQAAALIEDLKRQGYKVEIIKPEETPSSPADLEIQYELCEPDQAIKLAQELAAEFEADIAVESGAVSPLIESVANESVQPTLRESVETETDKPAKPIVNEPIEEPWIAEERPSEPEYVIYQESTSTDQNVATLMPEAARSETQEGLPQAPGVWSQGAAALVAWLGNSGESLQALWQAGLHRMREQRERAAIHSAEVRARREQRLLELTCRRAEALQKSRQIESARRAAAGYVSQLEREKSTTAQAEKEAEENVVSSHVSSRTNKVPIMSWWTPSQHMKSIAAGAAAAGALFALTLGISALRSRPASAPSSASPESPAAAASPQVTVKTNSIAPHDTSKPSASVAHKESSKLSPTATRAEARTQAAQEDDSVADDVVVRHFSPPPQKLQTQKLQSQASGVVKRYSDTDN